MPCYKPLIRLEDLNKWETAADGHKYHPAKIVSADPTKRNIKTIDWKDRKYKEQIIPCRKCIGCRLDYSRDWANRGYLETKTSKGQNYWCTLTYDDDHLKINDEVKTSDGITFTPDHDDWNGDLIPDDLSGFIHDLRQEMRLKHDNIGIKYIACGEYGEKNHRPHYHIILYNINLPTDSFYKSRIINNEFYWQNKIIEKHWDKGMSNITPVTWSNIAYTARYITKKVYGQDSEIHYAAKGQTQKEFLRVSKGIGRDYYEQNKHEIYKRDKIVIHNKAGTIESKPPKYYDNLYKKEYPEKWEKIEEKRKKENDNLTKLKMLNHSYTQLQMLEIEMKTFEDRTAQLIRSLEKERK